MIMASGFTLFFVSEENRERETRGWEEDGIKLEEREGKKGRSHYKHQSKGQGLKRGEGKF